jgi:ankyrin repeat protein
LKEDVEALRAAIRSGDLERVKALMSRNPELHRAPLGYGGDGPLTMAAECGRLKIAEWMIANGSDVHQGGDGPLMRAASGDRLPMMELLVRLGADVNAVWHGEYPVIFSPCESVDPVALRWMLQHGANPNPGTVTALDYVIGSYVRSAELRECVEILRAAGGTTKYDVPAVLDILCGRVAELARRLDEDAGLLARRFAGLDFGTTGARMLTLEGATLLHVAAEYQNLEAARLLLDRDAEVNALGPGGQTPLFHAVTQNEDRGLPMVRLLLESGADVAIRARVAGHYERPGEILECNVLGYAAAFEDEPVRGDKRKTVAFLRGLQM